MMNSRRIGDIELIQIIEFSGPTHDADWMLPGLPHAALRANASWLNPGFWIPSTNRLVFTMQLWLLKASDRIIVIDTGVGNAKMRPSPYQSMINTPVLDWLAAVGAPPDKVTHVVHTHLHGDHVGWDTRQEDGRWTPTFPNATYCIPKDDWGAYRPRYDAGDQNLLGGSFADSIMPVAEAGLVRFFGDDDEIAGCLLAHAAPGHSPGQVTLSLRHGDQHCIFSGDVLHSPMQVLFPDVNSRWCELPDVARATRHKLLADAAAANATIFPAHAAGLHGWKVSRRGEGYSVTVADAAPSLVPLTTEGTSSPSTVGACLTHSARSR
jgi:glyoxylase-like metal-dependent hydrolase (beta-lactamase superfamily II)